MAQQVPVDSEARADEIRTEGVHEVSPGLRYQRLAIVNVVYHGIRGAADGDWVLIDAGVPGSAPLILAAVERLFGEGARPAAIIQTHAHFDHVGALPELADRWDVPVYAHELERPYLDGSASYPPPDPEVGGGLMSRLSGFYPRGPVDVAGCLETLPEDGSVPGMPGWRWIHVPGHTPGQVALWHEADRTLIAADAFITTAQESAYAAAVQRPELHGPPMYYTQAWDEARESVRRLAALRPELVITGHGRAMEGQAMRDALETLARDFDSVAVPEDGYYVGAPARAEEGTAYRPADE